MSQELRKQLESLQEELFKTESSRDELQVKVELLERQAEESQTKEAELQVSTQSLKFHFEVETYVIFCVETGRPSHEVEG